MLIEGPKWCGKTTTAEQLAGSILYMDDPEKMDQNIAMSQLSPKRLLKGATPRLIDEWQLAPKLWDAIRFEVDHRGELGQFILTGSAVPASTKEITHSGTGRFSWLTMRPMSLYESGDSTGEVSLKDLFEGNPEFDRESSLNIERLAFLVCRGGWPQAIEMRDEIALDQATDYYEAVVHSDINRADNVQNLVYLRMNGGEGFHSHKISIKMSNSSGIRESDAAKIDAVLKGMKVGGNATVFNEAKNESRRYLEYEIEF